MPRLFFDMNHFSGIVRWLAAAGLALAGAAQAGQPLVAQVDAADLPAYLRAHEKVVVLFTSPDRGCGFCAEADKGFEQAVQKLADSGADLGQWRYAIVQWTPWHAIPPEAAALLAVQGVPNRGAFVKGKAVGWACGRERDIDRLTQKLLAAQAGQACLPRPADAEPSPPPPQGERAAAASAPGQSASAAPGAKPAKDLPPMQPAWVEVQGRMEYLAALRDNCGARHPESEVVFNALTLIWIMKKLALDEALDRDQTGWLLHPDGARAIDAQEAQFARTMREQTGLDHLAPQLDALSCERLFRAATAVPLPDVPSVPAAGR
jgi:hypothetical protein